MDSTCSIESISREFVINTIKLFKKISNFDVINLVWLNLVRRAGFCTSLKSINKNEKPYTNYYFSIPCFNK